MLKGQILSTLVNLVLVVFVFDVLLKLEINFILFLTFVRTSSNK